MKKILLLTCLSFAGYSQAQQCNQPIFPHIPSSGGGSYHILSDTTINDPNGANYYVCGGVTLTMTNTSGSNYQLEAGATLIINQHDGCNIIAKENCSITDYSTESLTVTKEASTTVSKPNAPQAVVIFTCAEVTFDYSQVGGSSPCGSVAGLNESNTEELRIFPNPITAGETIKFSASMEVVKIYDASGRLVRSVEMNGKSELETVVLEKGFYLIRGTSINGTQIEQRLIVQ